MFFSFLQLVGWVLVGYNLKAGNAWAVLAAILLALSMGLIQALWSVGKVMDGLSNSNKPN